MALNELLSRIDSGRSLIDAHRPLSPDEVRELDWYYKIGTTYSSNALEGNTLTLTETKILLEDGITVGGKPIIYFIEATGHAKAFDFMLSVARTENLTFSEDLVKRIHRLFYAGIDSEYAGTYRNHQVFISGTEYVPPTSGDVPALMKSYIAALNEKKDVLHPVLLAAFAHRQLVYIHPFADGNGRCARLLMNLIMVNKGYCIVSIPPILRHDYISALMAAQRTVNPTNEPFDTLIAECALEAQRDYFRMFCITSNADTQ